MHRGERAKVSRASCHLHVSVCVGRAAGTRDGWEAKRARGREREGALCLRILGRNQDTDESAAGAQLLVGCLLLMVV